MARQVLAQHDIPARLPAFARGLDVCNDLRAVAHRYLRLRVFGLWSPTQRPQGNPRRELGWRERLYIAIAFGGCSDGRIIGRAQLDAQRTRNFQHRGDARIAVGAERAAEAFTAQADEAVAATQLRDTL